MGETDRARPSHRVVSQALRVVPADNTVLIQFKESEPLRDLVTRSCVRPQNRAYKVLATFLAFGFMYIYVLTLQHQTSSLYEANIAWQTKMLPLTGAPGSQAGFLL